MLRDCDALTSRLFHIDPLAPVKTTDIVKAHMFVATLAVSVPMEIPCALVAAPPEGKRLQLFFMLLGVSRNPYPGTANLNDNPVHMDQLLNDIHKLGGGFGAGGLCGVGLALGGLMNVF